jgi:hypothetical protein
MAPVVVEISRRSGAPGELVLRRNAGPRRREETYLTHAELLRKIFTLPPERRLVFSPLGLSSEELGAVSLPPRAASGVVPAPAAEPPARRSSQPGRSAQPPPLTDRPTRTSQGGPTVIVSEPDDAAPESTDAPAGATPPLTA